MDENEIVRNFATIGEIYEDGVSLIFDGEEEPTEKHYLCNTSVIFHAGDRVRIVGESGTYIVEYPIGAPRMEESGEGGTEPTPQSISALVNGSYEFKLNDDGSLRAGNGVSLGHRLYYVKNAFLGGAGGEIHIGENSYAGLTGSKVGFFGATPITRQTLSTTLTNQGYSSATSSNYLTILNNIVGILQKLGLIG